MADETQCAHAGDCAAATGAEPRTTTRRTAILGGGILGLTALAACSKAGSTLAGSALPPSANAPAEAAQSTTSAPAHPATSHASSGSHPASSTHATTAHATSNGTHERATTAHGAPASTSSHSTSAPAGPPAGSIEQLSAVPVGGSMSAHINGQAACIAQPTPGTVVAFSATCTHLGCTVNGGGSTLHCPCHGSAFNAFTGAVVNGPASKPLPSIAVHVQDGYVVAG